MGIKDTNESKNAISVSPEPKRGSGNVTNKDRLYVTLHFRQGPSKMPGKEDTYHWGLLVGPKRETSKSMGTRYNAREIFTKEHGWTWSYDEQATELTFTFYILARFVVAKVRDRERLNAVLRGIPIRPEKEGWNCIGWVREALEELEKDGQALGTRMLEWDRIRDKAMEHVGEKIESGRYETKQANKDEVPTFDLIRNKEVIT